MKFHYVVEKKTKSVRDILRMAVTNVKKPKSARDICPWHLCPWQFQNARDNFQKNARDIEKKPVTNLKNRMSRA